MDVIERLPLEAASAHTLIACEHRHRYEFARELCRDRRVLDLCCGSGYGSAVLAETAATVTGVDNDVAVIDAARAAIRHERIHFEAADAVAYLEPLPRGKFEAVVCFEGLEHLPDLPRALAAFRRHAENGISLVVSVPNSKLFDEENPYHLTDFSYESAMAAFSDFPNTAVVAQFLAEGSVICPPGADSIDFVFARGDRMEIEYANHFIFCIGCEPDVLRRAHRGRLQVEAAAVDNRYMTNLEAANRELRRINAGLARKRLAVSGSAAAARLSRLEQEIVIRDEALGLANERADSAERDRDSWKSQCMAADEARRSALSSGHPAPARPAPADSPDGPQRRPPSAEPAASRGPARAQGLDVREGIDGLVVHQERPERAHYLNNTAAIVFELCDGQNTLREISDQLGELFGLTEGTIGLVEDCVSDLRAKGVVV